jgi:hypothetical protein
VRLGRACARAVAAVRLGRAAEGWPFGRARAAVRLGWAFRGLRAAVRLGCVFAELRAAVRLGCVLARLRGAGVVRADERAEDASPESFPRSPRTSDPAIRPASLAGASDSRAADEIALVIIGACSFISGGHRSDDRARFGPEKTRARR